MSRRTSSFEASIRGDELEQHRIQLEHNLQHTDLSLHLSSPPDDYSDVEYPRHLSDHHSYSGFASFERASRDAFENEESQYHQAWSHRTMDDEDGYHPYAAESVSTAAHHASALTLSAGLGGRGARRDVSLSGAEYDPDRPLQGIMAGLGSRMRGSSSNRSKNITSTTVEFDPLVVEDTTELDRVLQATHQSIRPSPPSASSSTSSSEPPSPASLPGSPRPKLSDALHRITFSPKRPRSAQSNLSSHPTRHKAKPEPLPAKQSVNPDYSSNSIRNRTHQSLSYGIHYSPNEPAELEVNVQPPTPLRPDNKVASRSTNKHNIRDQYAESRAESAPRNRGYATPLPIQSSIVRQRPGTKLDGLKTSASDAISHQSRSFGAPSFLAKTGGVRSQPNSKIHLPDVTGLTSAVGSPAKLGLDYLVYDGADDEGAAAGILATLGVVQSKLAFLESENSISRRRVRELELELEECKKEVARERTRVFEQDVSLSHVEDISRNPGKSVGAQTSMRNVPMEGNIGQSRYQEVVEEKKALEALITTLRAHLSRLTAELSDHRRLLQELRSLRDKDVAALKKKSREVDQLRQEVERLGGEVEVLRGVVEEGLKERRDVRDNFTAVSHSADGDEDTIRRENDQTQGRLSVDETRHTEAEVSDGSDDDSTSESTSRPSTPSTNPPRPDQRSVCSERSKIDFSQHVDITRSQPFINREELHRISEEVEERRSERSISASIASGSGSRSQLDRPSAPVNHVPRSASPVLSQASSHRSVGSRKAGKAANIEGNKCISPASRPMNDVLGEPCTGRSPSVQRLPITGSDSDRHSTHSKAKQIQESENPPVIPPLTAAPFPHIRGSRLEQLFFSVPDHDIHTCATCHRRRRRDLSTREDIESLRRRQFPGIGIPADTSSPDDEGFVEGDENDQCQRSDIGPEHEAYPDVQDDRLPPQTVLARVLRELEDDFAHFKVIYVELADQYRVIDAASNVAKRNILARHLQDVIDTLEQKGDQIASLYDLLTFSDKPIKTESNKMQSQKCQ